jgi:hypothetical protein
MAQIASKEETNMSNSIYHNLNGNSPTGKIVAVP